MEELSAAHLDCEKKPRSGLSWPTRQTLPITSKPRSPFLNVDWNPILPQLLASVSVSLCSMVVGFCQAYTSPALASMNHPNSTLTVTSQQASWIGSLLPLSALFGGILGGPIIETLGRKKTILLTAPPFVLSFLLISFAEGVAMVMVGRSISGFCVGVASLTLPVYLGETLEPKTRGSLGLLPTALGNAGILVCFVTGKFLDWSKLALLGACLSLPYLFLMFIIPETPRWYINKNDVQNAGKSLQWLRGKGADVTKELSEIQLSHQTYKEEETSARFKDFFKRRYLLPFGISIGLMFFQQMSGINAVIFYTVKIFQDAGSTVDSNLCAIIVGIVNFGSTFVATLIIDRLGRKILLYISCVSMIFTLMVLGAYFYLKDAHDVDLTAYAWVPLTSFVVFVIGFSIGFGPIPWLMMGEILPAKIRGNAASIVTAFNWACTFLVTKTFADITEYLGSHGAFWTFGGFCVVGLVFVVFLVPETQCKSLEDIEKHFSSKKGKKEIMSAESPPPAETTLTVVGQVS